VCACDFPVFFAERLDNCEIFRDECVSFLSGFWSRRVYPGNNGKRMRIASGNLIGYIQAETVAQFQASH